MDAAPLTTAHELAREALQNGPQSAVSAAGKHKAAAGEFAKAAEGMEDSEALRVLNLLEQHHQRLAQIISSSSDRSRSDGQNEPKAGQDVDSSIASTSVASRAASGSSRPALLEPSSQKASQSPVQRRPGRDLSSSIASNLATARGIPHSQHRRTQQSSTLKDSVTRQPSRHSQRDSSATGQSAVDNRLRNSSKDDTRSASREIVKSAQRDPGHDEAETPANPQGDDAFQKFYATFEGLLTKLSAPLAFAGLPLIAEEAQDASKTTIPSTQKPSVELTTPATSPDVSKIFSKAALHAVKQDHGPLGVQESFFVVPTAGGTISYAGVLSRAERQARHHSLETPLEEGGDDAGGDTGPDTEQMRSSKTLSKAPANPLRPSTKTTEELEIENESLKQLTDNLSRRLYMWEKSAQSQSMALQQSIRNLQPPARTLPDGAGTRNEEQEARELQEQLITAQKELERFGRENEKLTAVVLRYRQRWEKLKEGARVRREGTLKAADAQQNNEDSAGGPDV